MKEKAREKSVLLRVAISLALLSVRAATVMAMPLFPEPLSDGQAENGKAVLVVFHGLGETGRRDMEAVRKVGADSGDFKDVKTIDYDWKHDTVPSVAQRVFEELDRTYPPDTKFVFYGYSKGGVVADWITQRVKASEGRVIRVATVSSPLDGAWNLSNLYEILKDATERALDPAGDPNDATGVEKSLPGIAELLTGSPIMDKLRSPPLNRQDSVEYIRVYGEGDQIVQSGSALKRPLGEIGKFERVIIRTGKWGIEAHTTMRDLLAKHPKLLRRILENRLPREAEFGPLEVADDTVAEKNAIPDGWVPCSCPDANAGLGIWFEGTMYHSPAFHCPK